LIAGRQLPLPFPHVPGHEAAAFLQAPSNAEALAWLAPGTDWPTGRLALWGEEGVGKTHLLHIWAARVGAAVWHGAALGGLPPAPPAALALDDADACADPAALLHVINAAAERGGRLVLAGRDAPSRWPVALPDLVSRLRATTAVRVAAPEDSLLDALLARLLAERLLVVTAALQERMRLHLPRTPAALREAAARLDRLAMSAGRRLVRRRQVAELLADMTDAEALHDVFAADGSDASQDPGLLV
jgi:chromosomal replication initiation ATPase DnaA